jgi:hypothetical protein
MVTAHLLAGMLLIMIFYGYFRGFLPPGRLSIQMEVVVNSAEFIRYTRINTIDAILNLNGPVLLDALRHLDPAGSHPFGGQRGLHHEADALQHAGVSGQGIYSHRQGQGA